MSESSADPQRHQDEFLALVSHELRTPLTSIIGYVELVLDDEALSNDARRFLEIVLRNAQRQLRLVGDMLFVAQADAERLTFVREDVALSVIVEHCVDAARPAAAREGVEIEMTDAGATVDRVVGDRVRLGQAIDNLIVNAVKFAPRGTTVTVALGLEDAYFTVDVIDRGAGIPLDDQAHLFERFSRSSSAVSRRLPGAGLGLAVVKSITEAHGGAASLTSAPGEGTTVRITLPVADGEAA